MHVQADEDPAVLRRHAPDALILPRAYPVAQAFVAQMATLAEKAAAGERHFKSRRFPLEWQVRDIRVVVPLRNLCKPV